MSTLIQKRTQLGAALVLACIVLVTFKPLLDVGFFSEDNSNYGNAARLPLVQFTARYFRWDTAASFYRPAEDLFDWMQFHLFGDNPRPYRAVEILMHLANCLLLMILAGRLTRTWQVGFLAALLYSALPLVNTAFLWLTNPDRLVGLFYLLAILAWLNYTSRSKKRYSVLALCAFVLALLTKENGAALPLVLVVLDLWAFRKLHNKRFDLRRYWPFALVLLLYGLDYVPRLIGFGQHAYAGPYAGLGLGPHIFSNLAYYLGALANPWVLAWPLSVVGPLILLSLAVYLVIKGRIKDLAMVVLLAIAPLLPVLLFNFNGNRYLYVSAMALVALIAALLWCVPRIRYSRRALAVVAAAVLAVAASISSLTDIGAFEGMVTFVREWRSPVRAVFQQHRTFQADTLLYFVNSPLPWDILDGMFVLRYGTNVSANGTDHAVPAELSRHRAALVIAYDEQNRMIEQPVVAGTAVQSKPALPLNFAVPLRLDGYEVVTQRVRRGGMVSVLLYWRALAKLGKDYTLFAHLVDPAGETVAAYDSQPRGGRAPTSSWEENNLIVDWVLIPVAEEVPAGEDYSLELGWYYSPTMERMGIVDAAGNSLGDHLTLAPFAVDANSTGQ